MCAVISDTVLDPHLTGTSRSFTRCLTLNGGGNILLVHVGAIYRLYELGYLVKTKIRESPECPLRSEELDIICKWDLWAGEGLNRSERMAEEFALSARALRKRGWSLMWRSPKPRAVTDRDVWGELYISPTVAIRWDANSLDPKEERSHSFRLDDEIHQGMKRLAASQNYLSEAGMDYLIDWGYALCDAAFALKEIGVSGEQRALVSPNRLFYRSFDRAHEESLLRAAAALAEVSPSSIRDGKAA